MQLFFFPYFGGAPSEYDAVLPQLDKFECVAFSNTGLGRNGDTYSVRQAIKDMESLISSHAEPTGEYVLIGHSMTGKMALGVAAHAPRGLKGVLLLAPSPPTPEPIPDVVRNRMLTQHGTREAAITTIRAASHRTIEGEALEKAITADLQTDERDWINWLEIGSREDISDVLPQIHLPVRVVIGQYDGGMTPDLMNREIVSKIAGTRLETITGAAHLTPIEAPDQVAAHIQQFVADIS